MTTLHNFKSNQSPQFSIVPVENYERNQSFLAYHNNPKLNPMASCLRIKKQIQRSYWRSQRDIIAKIYHSSGLNT